MTGLSPIAKAIFAKRAQSMLGRDSALMLYIEGEPDVAAIGDVIGETYYLTWFWHNELIERIEEALARIA
jgi:hypothetical protein